MPVHFDELDKQQAGALIATLRRHGHLPANHSVVADRPDDRLRSMQRDRWRQETIPSAMQYAVREGRKAHP